MKSKITIEVDFENNNLPVLRIMQCDSDDVRDKLLSSFLQSLQHTSRWARIEYDRQMTYQNAVDESTHRWFIRPITPQEIESENKLMKATLEHYHFSPKLSPTEEFKPITVENGVLRRSRLDLNSPTELAIRKAMEYVEDMGASKILTDAIISLEKALNLVADHIEGRKE